MAIMLHGKALLCGRISSKLALSTKSVKFSKISAIFVVQKANYSALGSFIQTVKFKFPQPRHHLDNDKWAKLFCVEGNISAGKAKFAEEFSKIVGLRYFPHATVNYDIEREIYENAAPEKIEWNTNPESMMQLSRNVELDHFLKHPEDSVHSTRYQLFMLRSRYYQYCDATSHLLRQGQGACVVRNFYTDDVHVHAMKALRWIPKKYFDHYDLVRKTVDENIIPPQIVFYLHVSPEECYERVQSGDNEAEKHLPLEYYRLVEKYYRDHYMPMAKERGVYFIELDWSKPTPVQEVVDDLDAMPTLTPIYNLWSVHNMELKRIMKSCEDMVYRESQLQVFCPMQELWGPDWENECLFKQEEVAPWRFQKGQNRELGDKWVCLKS